MKTFGGATAADHVAGSSPIITDPGFNPMTAVNPTKCATSCSKSLRDRCTGFEWNSQTGECYFWQTLPVNFPVNHGTSNYQFFTRIDGRPKDVIFPYYGCSWVGGNYPGSPHLRGVATAKSCHALCRKTPGCILSTVDGSQDCWLKKSTQGCGGAAFSGYITNGKTHILSLESFVTFFIKSF